MERRKFIHQSALDSAAFLLPGDKKATFNDFPIVRPPESMRRFKSRTIENAINVVRQGIQNQEIAWLFNNCFPNTLDTTVDFDIVNGKPDTYVITGDIDAMWLRDNSAQVWPYLSFVREDECLGLLIQGVIRRQTRCILKDPYANAFYKDDQRISEWKATDLTDMRPGIHERKWEVDSLCYPIRLAHGYWNASGNTSAFGEEWVEAMRLVVRTFREQQRKDGDGPYTFQRRTDWATDGVPLSVYGYPAKKVGLIHSMFRPSDDATIFPFLIPSNCFAAVSLQFLVKMAGAVGRQDLASDAEALRQEIDKALIGYSTIVQPEFGQIYVYETNGFGSHNLMDDANIPSLLSLPYLQFCQISDPVYQQTRRYVLSPQNPFFFVGSAGQGIGGPHAGMNMVWPLSITMRALTTDNDDEIRFCLDMLRKSHHGTGYMHESFNKDDTGQFTRKWFAWANTLFGELVWKTFTEKKALLD